jgi:hypothetical protein
MSSPQFKLTHYRGGGFFGVGLGLGLSEAPGASSISVVAPLFRCYLIASWSVFNFGPA